MTRYAATQAFIRVKGSSTEVHDVQRLKEKLYTLSARRISDQPSLSTMYFLKLAFFAPFLQLPFREQIPRKTERIAVGGTLHGGV